MGSGGTPGLDQPSVSRWFAEHVPNASPPLAFDRIPGGRSNLSFEVRDGDGHRWVLRRPPLGHTLPTAHDMSREVTVLRALGPTSVPVPEVVALCTDERVSGSAFFVMAFVDGLACRHPADAEALDVEARRRAGLDLVRVLAGLHQLDPGSVGLGRFGRPDGYVERQLRRWHGQWQAERTRDLAALEAAHARLRDRIPPQRRTSVVHGDYRLDNCLLGPDGDVRAVLDWEISTLGDPRADLGMMLAYWGETGDELTPLMNPPTRLGGFPTRTELVEAYLAAAGAESADELAYFLAFSWWKIAAILEGVYTRTARGALGAADRGEGTALGEHAVRVAGRALDLAAAL